MNDTKTTANRKRRLAKLIYDVIAITFLMTIVLVGTHVSASAIGKSPELPAPVAMKGVVSQKRLPSTIKEIHEDLTKKEAEISKLILPPTKTNATKKLEAVLETAKPMSTESTTRATTTETESKSASVNGPSKNHLTRSAGVFNGPSGKETYYNLNMSGVVRIMKNMGYDYSYWVRDDGVKMFGPYVMVAANLEIRPKGTILETSLGTAMVCDTGSFAQNNPRQLDIAVNW